MKIKVLGGYTIHTEVTKFSSCMTLMLRVERPGLPWIPVSLDLPFFLVEILCVCWGGRGGGAFVQDFPRCLKPTTHRLNGSRTDISAHEILWSSMGQIYLFSFSKPGIQINPGQITALPKHPSKAEISKRPPGIKKLYHLLVLQHKEAVKWLKKNMAVLQV